VRVGFNTLYNPLFPEIWATSFNKSMFFRLLWGQN